jgi:hypothetical protein
MADVSVKKVCPNKGEIMSKNAPRPIHEIEDPAEAVVASAEWIVRNEFISSMLERLAERRRLRGETDA